MVFTVKNMIKMVFTVKNMIKIVKNNCSKKCFFNKSKNVFNTLVHSSLKPKNVFNTLVHSCYW